MAKKKITHNIRLQLDAGKANPAPPVGTVLGPTGMNMAEFCQQYNEKTRDQMGMVIPVDITIYEDRSYDFVLRTPPASFLLKKAAGIDKGAAEPQKARAGTITQAQLLEIGEIKREDLNANSAEQAAKVIGGTARSMGIKVVD